MMLSLDTAYRSFGGEVEASITPTICRLPDSRRHQLSAIAPATKSIRCGRREYRLTATPSVSHRQSKKTGPERISGRSRKMALLKRDLYRQVEGPEVTHADRCTLVFDTDSKSLYVERNQTATMDIADYLKQGGHT